MVGFNATRWIAVAGAALGLMLPQAALAQGGMLDCLPLGQPLPKIPEIVAQRTSGVAGAGGRAARHHPAGERKAADWRSASRPASAIAPGKPGLYFVCRQQTVRVFRGLNAQPAMPLVPQDRIGDPMPGPTLRARLGDIVQLTFVNNINPNQFPYSIDQGEERRGPAAIPARRATRPRPAIRIPTASTGRAPATSISTARTRTRTAQATTCFSRSGPRRS